MSNTILVIGQSGTGKSTSLRNLDEKTTFIINVLDKPLPFKGYKKKYKMIKSWDDKEGNYFTTNNWEKIIKCIKSVNALRPEITTLVIDDWQYILAMEFMSRVAEKGYDKFSELANHGWQTINACMSTRPNLTCVLLAHSDQDANGRAKIKTIGKLLDEKITLEGLFTIVLHSRLIDGQYLFQTQCDNEYLAKSPMGMFNDLLIPNDLVNVKNAVEAYYNDNEEEQVA